MIRDTYITLNKKRSIIALIAACITFVMTFSSVVMGLVNDPNLGLRLFYYFTVISNILAAIGACLIIPFAVEGIRKMRFTIPRWVFILEFIGTAGVTVTFLFTVLISLPVEGVSVISGIYFWLHIICPISAMVLFYSTENFFVLKMKDVLITMTPFVMYFIVYLTMVFILKGRYGHWRDIYRLGEYVPFWVSAPVLFMFAFGVAYLHSFLSNKMVKKREKRMISELGDVVNLSDVELCVEAFGLGNFMASNGNDSEVLIPMDLISILSANKEDGLKERMVQSFIKGYLNN